jgi:hypothetical protein
MIVYVKVVKGRRSLREIGVPAFCCEEAQWAWYDVFFWVGAWTRVPQEWRACYTSVTVSVEGASYLRPIFFCPFCGHAITLSRVTGVKEQRAKRAADCRISPYVDVERREHERIMQAVGLAARSNGSG